MKRFVQCIDCIDLEEIEDKCILPEVSELRYGDEFCFRKCISFAKIDEAFDLAIRYKKSISFIYPRLNDDEMDRVKRQLHKLNEFGESIYIIANDLGIGQYIVSCSLNNLKIVLGRQAISVPMRARPAMPSVMGKDNVIADLADKKLFYLTNVNYKRTLKFLKKMNIYGLEFDYIPKTFPLIKKLQKEGIHAYIHKGNVMVALTRRCHTQRLYGETQDCNLICKERRLRLFHEVTNELFMDGNAILAAVPQYDNELKELQKDMFSIIDSHKWIAEYMT